MKLNERKGNRYCMSPDEDYIAGYTYDGVKFIIDKEDYELVKKYTWHHNSHKKSRQYISSYDNENKRFILLHRYIMGVLDKPKIIIDHINGIVTDNRKQNLRMVTQSQNLLNLAIKSNNTSGYPGVYFDKRRKKKTWYAQISIHGKTFSKCADSFEEAVKIRKEMECQYFGEYARKYDEKNDMSIYEDEELFEPITFKELYDWKKKEEGDDLW